MTRNGWIVIAVSGVTNGGKTTLAKNLVKTFPGSIKLTQDDYFHQPNHPNHIQVYVDQARLFHNNWEVTTAVDSESLERDIRRIITSPPPSGAPGLLIIEGFLLFNFERMLDLFDLRYFLQIPYEVCVERRSRRTYDPADPVGYFTQVVWPMFLQNKEHAKSLYWFDNSEEDKQSRLVVKVIDGTLSREEILEDVVKDIKRLGKEKETAL